MNNLKAFKKGKKIKSATKLPNFILKIKGKFDSRKGKTVPDAYIDKLKSKCESIENNEAIVAEEILFEDRKNGAVCISNISEVKAKLSSQSDTSSLSGAAAIRENRRKNAEMSGNAAKINNCIQQLNGINEHIINIDTILDERITRLRKKSHEKINVYISGVRSGKLKDYECDFEFSNDAQTIYRKKHEKGDELIRKAVEIS